MGCSDQSYPALRDVLSTGYKFYPIVGLDIGGGFSAELHEESNHSVRVIGDVEGDHVHIIREEVGFSSFVEYVVNEGSKGSAC